MAEMSIPLAWFLSVVRCVVPEDRYCRHDLVVVSVEVHGRLKDIQNTLVKSFLCAEFLAVSQLMLPHGCQR